MNIKVSKNFSFFGIAGTIIVLFFLVCMISQPARFLSASLNGISAWAFNVLPSVLPFMFFTRLLSALGQMEKLTKPFSSASNFLFRTPPISMYAFFMAILSGYPVGSKMVADLFEQHKISRQDAFRMSAFCSTSGPMFIIGAVGIGMFKNATVGYILFASHVLGAILNGIIFRNLKVKEQTFSAQSLEKSAPSTPIDISQIVSSSTLAILSVGCIITIFFIVIECFSPVLSLLPQSLRGFVAGTIEITKGCLDLSALSNVRLATCLCSFVISFGGLSTVLQSLTMLAKVNMPVKLFILQKISHGILSTLVAVGLIFLFL